MTDIPCVSIGCTNTASTKIDQFDLCRTCAIAAAAHTDHPTKRKTSTDGLCQCGCGAEVRGRWKQGHNARKVDA